MGAVCVHLPSQLQDPICGRTVQAQCMSYSPPEFICALVVLCLEGLDSSGSSIPSDVYTLSGFSSAEFPEPWREGLDGDINAKFQSLCAAEKNVFFSIYVTISVDVC